MRFNKFENAAIAFMAIALISTLYTVNRIFFLDLMVFILFIASGLIKHLFWAYMVVYFTTRLCDSIKALRKD